jgi:hypothetical protein
MDKKLEDDPLYKILVEGSALQEEQADAARWIKRLTDEVKRKPNFWVATYGDRGLEVVHYHEEKPFRDEVERVKKLHESGRLDSFTWGQF